MDSGTGKLFDADPEIAKRLGLVPVRRDLTEKERAEMQIALYAPCGCGSGKKFKFCCRQNRIDELNRRLKDALAAPTPKDETGE